MLYKHDSKTEILFVLAIIRKPLRSKSEPEPVRKIKQ